MNFSTDRDLLAWEPAIFADLSLLAGPRASVMDAEASGTMLSSAAANFVEAQVEPGCVVLVAGEAHEVTARIDAHTLGVSRLRTRTGDAAIPGVQGSGLPLTVRTFAPQAALMHDALLAVLGVDEDAIVSLSAMGRLETLGTLERLYATAGTLLEGGWRDTFLIKADAYRARFRDALRCTRILVDLDGDGIGERRLEFGAARLVRA